MTGKFDNEWIDAYPELKRLESSAAKILQAAIRPGDLAQGEAAYRVGSRVRPTLSLSKDEHACSEFPTPAARSLYRVSAGETCVVTTSCLLSGTCYPAESFAETPVRKVEIDVIHKTHEQLAIELGSVREVVSRQLKEFEGKGWIKLGRANITISRRNALDDVARQV